MTSFTGIWVPLVTPFRDREIDFPALQALARRIAQSGVSGLVVCGSTGEAASLSEREQLAALDAVLEAVPTCPVVMGLAGNNLPAMLERMARMQDRPISGFLAPPPYYIRPSQAGIIEYFNTVANAASAPLIVYNIPYRTGVAIEAETFKALARHDRIVALKDCGGDQMLTMNLIAEAKLQLLAGEDHQLLSTLSLGGSGAILASAHLRPDLFVRLACHVQVDELEDARKIFYRLLPMIQLLFKEPNPAPLKAALAMMGEMREELRAPMQGASAEMKEKLEQQLKRLECL